MNILWETIVSAFFGSLVATAIVAYLTQQWIERRERRKHRDELRLNLYLDIVDLILEDEESIAAKSGKGDIPALELQKRRISVFHRLQLLGSQHVRDKYAVYKKLVFQETELPLEHGPQDPNEVVRARDDLVAGMAADVQDVPKHCSLRLCRN